MILGRLDPKASRKRLVVIGGGFSGLLLAYRLKPFFERVEIFEKSARLGGLIQTTLTGHALFETAAHSIRMTETGRRFFEELGVEYTPVLKSGRARFIARG